MKNIRINVQSATRTRVIALFSGFVVVAVAQHQLIPRHTSAYQHAAECFRFQADAGDTKQPNSPTLIWLKAF